MNRRRFLASAGAAGALAAVGGVKELLKPAMLLKPTQNPWLRNAGASYLAAQYYHMGIDTAANGESVTVFRRIERRIRVKEDGAFEDEWVETGNLVLDNRQNLRYFEDAMKNFRATNRPFTANAPQTHQGSGAART